METPRFCALSSAGIMLILLIFRGLTLAQPPGSASARTNLHIRSADSIRAQMYLDRSAILLNRSSDSALLYAKKSLTLTESASRLRSRTYLVMGRIYFRQSDYANALAALQQARIIQQAYPPDSITLEIQVRTAQTYHSYGRYAKALQLMLAALQTYEPISNRAGNQLGTLYTELGVLYDYLHQYDKARVFHLKRLAFSQKQGNPVRIVSAYHNLGAFYANVHELALAEINYRKALQYARQLNLFAETGDLLASLGDIAYQRHHYGEAIRFLNQGLLIHQKTGATENGGTCLLNLAQAYQGLHQHARALQFCNQALIIFRSTQSAPYLSQALDLKSQLLFQTGDHKNAYLLSQQAHALKDSLVGLDKQKAAAQIQALYELEQKQQQIAGLQRNLTAQQHARKTAQLQLSLNQQRQLFYWVSLALLSLLLFLSVISYRKLKKAQQLLSQQNLAISQQAQQLSQLNATKDKLFSLIGHDLRAPLARLKASVYQLRTNSPPAPWLPPLLRPLDNQINQLLELLTNLLDWSYVQFKGQLPIQHSFLLSDSVAETLTQLAQVLEQKQIQIIDQVDPKLDVFGNKAQLNAVLRNLISNAIKFTSPVGFIRLHTQAETQQIVLHVRDSGIGMSEEDLAVVLNSPKVRSGTQGETGTGLGLRLCQDLLTSQGGRLSISSRPGEGTTVSVYLPTLHISGG